MTDEKEILELMMETICSERECLFCKMHRRCLSSNEIEQGNYTQEEIDYVVQVYKEYYPDSSLSLPKINISAEEINNIFTGVNQ